MNTNNILLNLVIFGEREKLAEISEVLNPHLDRFLGKVQNAQYGVHSWLLCVGFSDVDSRAGFLEAIQENFSILKDHNEKNKFFFDEQTGEKQLLKIKKFNDQLQKFAQGNYYFLDRIKP